MPLDIVFGFEPGEELVRDAKLWTALVADEWQLDAIRRLRAGGAAVSELHLDRAGQQYPQRLSLLGGPRLELSEKWRGDIDGGSCSHKRIKAYLRAVVKHNERLDAPSRS